MIQSTRTPSIDLEGFTSIVFGYEAEDDIAMIHFDGPRPAITEEADDGWYLRLADDTVIGMELHGFRVGMLTRPQFLRAFEPAIRELEAHAGKSLESGLVVSGTLAELPRTTHLAIFLTGQGLARLEALRQEEMKAAARKFFDS